MCAERECTGVRGDKKIKRWATSPPTRVTLSSWILSEPRRRRAAPADKRSVGRRRASARWSESADALWT